MPISIKCALQLLDESNAISIMQKEEYIINWEIAIIEKNADYKTKKMNCNFIFISEIQICMNFLSVENKNTRSFSRHSFF